VRSHTRHELVWVRYNPRNQLVSLAGVSLLAEVANRRLCDYIWSGSPWPAPDFAIAGALTRVPPESWDQVLAELLSVGWRTRKGLLFHPAVASVRNEARAFQRASQARTAAARAVRWPDNIARNDPPAPALLQSPLQAPSNITEQYSTEHPLSGKTAERLTLSGSAPKEGDNREKEFLEELHATIQRFSPPSAAAEMRNWGGWWRNRFRENPAKAARVLAEVASMVKERRIKRNPGAAGLDLWNRLP
jgi:hypothetical protein